MTKPVKTIKADAAIDLTKNADKSLPTGPTETIAPAASAPVVEAAAPGAGVAVTAHVTKASIARPIFNSFIVDGKLTAERKVVIKAIMDGANLSEKGAATYYQNFKDKAGLVVKKTAAAPAVAA